MQRTRHSIRSRIGIGALVASFVMLGATCTGQDGSVDVVMDDGTQSDPATMAMDNAYGAAGSTAEGAAIDAGAYLDVEYFEALRKADWTAPEHCWFSTKVSVNGQISSPGFDGPRSDDDRGAGEGLLVGSIESVVFDTEAFAPYGVPPAHELQDGEVSDSTIVYQENFEQPIQHDAVVALVAVFGHDQVVEISSDHPSVIAGFGLQAQPVDGWNLLRIALDPGTAPADSIDVVVRRVHEDGTETNETVAVPLDSDELQLLTRDWAFDLSKVDASCAVPSGSSDNTPLPTETDVFGSPVGDAPKLPAPGLQPENPTSAADEALASLRAVYDLTDRYAESKRDHIEDPEAYDEIRTALLVNDVVRPYLSNLDPVFRSAVFVSPTEAHILYRVGPSYQWEIGRVLLIDGRWRVAAGTFCRDLSAAGYSCPGVVKDPAPGPLG